MSDVTRALAAGSGLEFEDRGFQHLKGIEEPHHLFVLVGSWVARALTTPAPSSALM